MRELETLALNKIREVIQAIEIAKHVDQVISSLYSVASLLFPLDNCLIAGSIDHKYREQVCDGIVDFFTGIQFFVHTHTNGHTSFCSYGCSGVFRCLVSMFHLRKWGLSGGMLFTRELHFHHLLGFCYLVMLFLSKYLLGCLYLETSGLLY